MKCFWMMMVVVFFGACYVPKKDKAEEGRPSEPVAECTTASDCNDNSACTDDSCVDGDCAHAFKACDDGDPCTTDSCDAAAGCVNTVGACCADGTVCDDQNPCTDDSCDAATDQCSYASNAASCDDGNACTVNDVCSDGQCQSGVVKDCDDSDPCTTDFCDGTGACVYVDACEPDTVQSEPDTVPTVDTEEPAPDIASTPGPDTTEAEPDTDQPSPDVEPVCVPDCSGGKQCGPDGCGGVCGVCAGGNACVKASCDSGVCSYSAVDCNDGNACTTDSCDADKGCQYVAVLCGDKNLCTDDSCDEVFGCFYKLIICDDGNVCTDDSCDPAAGGCVYKDASDCDDDSDLTVDFCHPTAGCQHIFIGECKIDEVCDDGDKCTDDSCNPATGKCEHKSVDCDDENACTKDSCDAADGCTNSPINCADDDQCTDDSCDPETGECEHEFNSAPCDDGNPCTSEDKCVDGECLDGKSICECEEDADCADYEDGNLCNGTLVCVSNKCMVDAETVVVCAPSTDACAKSVCVSATGECDTETANSGLVCNDGSACTSGDICWGGACAGMQINCDDGNICTTDSCDAAIGCEHESNTAVCNDGSSLTSGDTCSLGVCSGVLATVECDSDTDCQDGKYCNGYEFCVAGQCKPGFLPDCDDGIACTVDLCIEEYYGVNCENTPDDSLCPQGQKCAMTWELGGGCVECKGSWDCDDSNPCTTDSCDWISTGKCVHTNNTAWCDDGKPCTVNESCVNGACGNGAVKYCNDYNDCTVDSCDPTSGCKYTAYTGGGILSCGVGACTTTVSKCVAGVKQTCVAKAPGVEACGNGLDDDCDGAVDEGCVPPPPVPPTFKVEVSCSAGACEPWIFHSPDGLGLPTDTHGDGPLTATLTQKQACGDWGFEVAVRDKTVATWPWYGCDSAISLTTVTVKVNGAVKAGVLTKHPWACQGGGEGNLVFSKTLIGCP